MLKTCEKNPLVFQETDQPYRYDRILHMRLQFARQSTTCLGLPKNPSDHDIPNVLRNVKEH